MGVPRIYKNCMETCGFLLCSSIAIYTFTNIIDLGYFSTFHGIAGDGGGAGIQTAAGTAGDAAAYGGGAGIKTVSSMAGDAAGYGSGAGIKTAADITGDSAGYGGGAGNKTAAESSGFPLTLHCNLGRLGNQMCTYATLYGLSALNRRKFVSLNCNIKHLRQIFVGPAKAKSVFSSQYSKSNPWKIQPYLKPEDAVIPRNCNYIQGYYHPCSYTFFDHARDEIRKEFQFQDHLRQHGQAILLKANVLNFSSPTYVGVHVRRGDYDKRWLKVFDGVPVNMEYFRKALEYFREKYKNVIFIAISEDRMWCIEKLSLELGAYVPEEAPSPAHDLAVLASCNHTVMTYGTFGFWGAYLAGGEVLYFDKFLKPNTSFTLREFVFEKMYPPHWKGLVTVNSSYWS